MDLRDASASKKCVNNLSTSPATPSPSATVATASTLRRVEKRRWVAAMMMMMMLTWGWVASTPVSSSLLSRSCLTCSVSSTLEYLRKYRNIKIHDHHLDKMIVEPQLHWNWDQGRPVQQGRAGRPPDRHWCKILILARIGPHHFLDKF